jgi:uncharacterized protein (DUF1697 family)
MSTTAPQVYVALLRGINVGGKTKVTMAELKLCFERLGFGRVTTYINSGNVIFTSPQKDPRILEKTIERSLQATFSLPINTVVRSQTEIKNLLDHLPASWRSDAAQKCNVIFLRPAIDSAKILEGLHPKPGIEELHYYPGVLFWSAPSSNLGKSEMIKLSAKPIYKEMTVRILNTVRKIYDVMSAVTPR